MAFADSISHLDGDAIEIPFLVVPRPNSSVLYSVPKPRPELFLAAGDLLVVERDRPMRGSSLVLVTIDGQIRLVQIRRERGRFVFDGMPEDDFDAAVETLGVPTRVIRFLEGNTGVQGSPGLRDRLR